MGNSGLGTLSDSGRNLVPACFASASSSAPSTPCHAHVRRCLRHARVLHVHAVHAVRCTVRRKVRFAPHLFVRVASARPCTHLSWVRPPESPPPTPCSTGARRDARCASTSPRWRVSSPRGGGPQLGVGVAHARVHASSPRRKRRACVRLCKGNWSKTQQAGARAGSSGVCMARSVGRTRRRAVHRWVLRRSSRRRDLASDFSHGGRMTHKKFLASARTQV